MARDIVSIVLLLLISLTMLALLTHPVNAENESYVVVSDYPGTPISEVQRIEQGAQVYINDTIDISGACSDVTRIAWYGRYYDSFSPEDDSPQYILDLPGSTSGYYTFYLDPATFASKPGWWYKYYANLEYDSYNHQRAGNLRAFYVLPEYRNVTALGKDGNYTSETEYPDVNPVPTPTPSIVDDRKVSDYLVAHGDPLDIYVRDISRVWVFGRDDMLVKSSDTNNVTHFSEEEVWGLETGTYTILAQYAGKNTVYDASLVNHTLVPGLYGKGVVDVYGLSPQMVSSKLIGMLQGSDDTFDVSSLEVQDPTISITSIDSHYVLGKSVLEVKGYTNAKNGTELSFVVDEDKQTARTINSATFHTTAVTPKHGYMSWYRIYIPVDFDNAVPGEHFLMATTPIGAVSTVPWYVYNMPEDSYVPNRTIKYVSGRYGDAEFVPTPTPVIVEKERIVQVQIPVTVEVPPSQESVDAAQKKATEEVALIWMYHIAGICAFLLLLWYGGKYAMSVLRRIKE